MSGSNGEEITYMKRHLVRILIILSLTMNLLCVIGAIVITEKKGGLPWLSRKVAEVFHPAEPPGIRDDWQQPDRVISSLALKPGTRVADIGCGEGYFALRLAKSVGEQGLVFAVDVDTRPLEVLRKHAKEEHLANVVVVVSGPTDTKLQPACVDVVFVCDVLHEVPETQRLPLLKNAVRALKPGGLFYLIDYRKSKDVTFDPYEKLIPRDDLVRICTDAGLRLDGEFHYLKYQVFLRFQKPM
jgi:ubiquinone/menaquinone biosynthesis C-methylase UbiE